MGMMSQGLVMSQRSELQYRDENRGCNQELDAKSFVEELMAVAEHNALGLLAIGNFKSASKRPQGLSGIHNKHWQKGPEQARDVNNSPDAVNMTRLP